MSMFGAIKKAINSGTRLKKRVFDPEKMSVEDITLPICLRGMDIEDARLKVKEEYDTFKSLGYVNMPIEKLKEQEYHAYQIGLILRFLQESKVYIMTDLDKVIPSLALHMTKRQLHVKVFDIVYRFNETVKSDWLKQDLERDLRWTPLEMAYLLRYATTEDRTIPKSR
ncbi:MAG: hypothetical protein U9Q04_03705 [Campylobacterota bacterium]|nr:hypothetical protein [Campylobacterota bacterium]